MAKRTFTKKFMIGVLDRDDPEIEIISDEITGNGRWCIYHELIFKCEGKFYRSCYSVGATESQDESPWDYEEEVICAEVVPIEKTVIAYVEA